jgi:hypothetical protein
MPETSMPAKSDISKTDANSETLETKDNNEEYGHYDDIHDKWASAFGECTSANEQMCWDWNQASLDQDCGPGSDHEHCWRSKIYRPYIPADPNDYTVAPISNEDKKLASQLITAGWNKPLQTPATYFVTSDLNDTDRQIVENGIKAAEEYLGSYGPMRVYVIGSDTSATDTAIEDYCAWAYNPEFLENCRNDQGVAIWEIAHYRGSNAFAQHSRNRSTPTQSFVIGNPAGLGPGDGAKISAHEYVHIYTAAHQLYNAADRYGLDWPIWLEEGAAEFLALYLADQKGWMSFQERMTEALHSAHQLRSIVPNLTIADIAIDRDRVSAYCGLCFGTLQYETGQWATAWLAHKTSIDAVFLDYFPLVYDLGIKDAFKQVFDLSVDEFMVEFESFMNLPLDEQLRILPIP